MSQTDSAEIEALRDELARLRSRLIEIEERPVGVYKRSMIDKMGAIGGLLALVIAIGTGTVTFYDNVILRGEKQAAAEREDLRSWFAEFADMNAQIAQAQSSADWGRVQALMNSFATRKERLLKKIGDVYREDQSLFNQRDRFLLAEEVSRLGARDQALKLMDDVLASPDLDPQSRAEALASQARYTGLQGPTHDPERARRSYHEAIDLTDNLPSSAGDPLRLQFMTELLQFELSPAGTCENAAAVLARIDAELQSDQLARFHADSAARNVAMAIEQAPPRCGFTTDIR